MNTGHGERLSRKQEQAIAALLEQPTIEQAAATVGVNEKTLRLWRKRPDFQAAFLAARRQIVDTTTTRLQQLGIAAVLALHRNLNCGKPSVEVRCVEIILQYSLKAVELGDLLLRVEQLEQMQAKSGK
jgi:hypothetical protein